MPLKAGTTSNYDDSMAQAIERAFRREWPSVMKEMDLPATTSPDLKLLFVAIAQGVVAYLKTHQSSFEVGVTVYSSQSHSHSASATVDIKTTGTLYTT